jgi:AcrR family transcriptional regulator
MVDTLVSFCYYCVMVTESLRTRQAALARTAIIEALVHHLEKGDVDEIAMEELAREAGVSRRTLYRYFPTRADLLAGAGEWISSEMLQLPIDIGSEGIAASFSDAANRLQRRPRLARALLRTEAGRAVRNAPRRKRVAAIRRALESEVPRASPSALKRTAAVLAYLCSSNAWTSIQDESGLTASHAQNAVVWAIETLIDGLRDEAKTT